MRLEEMLEKKQMKEIWDKYCGFLDLDMDEYMKMQTKLLEEQIPIWSNSELGQQILKGKHPQTIEEFRKMVPLTAYEDYAEILLQKKASMLPEEPEIWIQTTWEGGTHPVKVAPYTRNMLNIYRENVTACLILSTSSEKGKFDVSPDYKFLYALAPLPFATGLVPSVLGEEISIGFLPPVEKAVNMSFSGRNKLGFQMAMKEDVEFFFGLGSVAHAVSLSLSSMSSKAGKLKLSELRKFKPHMLHRIVRAKRICKKEGRGLLPKDLFHLKGFMVAGTDNNCYKDDLERLWGIRPMEMFAGTEPTVVGTETWTRKGMYFFPNSCFYEFIAEKDMLRNHEDPSYEPPTCLMNEVVPGEKYELVLTVLRGGAFSRYRVGDTYRCVGLTNSEDQTKIPRFEYVDRVPWIIDIGGFTRISEEGIKRVMTLSEKPVRGWVARKEHNGEGHPYLHIYVEIEEAGYANNAITDEIIKELYTIYFKFIDQDYRDLEKILGMDPLAVTVLSCGTFDAYEAQGNTIGHMNPPEDAFVKLMQFHKE